MKGNALLLSMLLLMSGAAYSMGIEGVDGVTTTEHEFSAEGVSTTSSVKEYAEVVTEVQGAAASRMDAMKARLGAAWGWVGSKATAAKDKIAQAWNNKPAISDIKAKIPTWQDVKAACALRNIKEKALNLPTTINNHKVATGLIIGVPLAAIVAWKLWLHCKELQKSPKCRKRVIG